MPDLPFFFPYHKRNMKNKIQVVLQSFNNGATSDNALDFFQILGYNTERQNSQLDMMGVLPTLPLLPTLSLYKLFGKT